MNYQTDEIFGSRVSFSNLRKGFIMKKYGSVGDSGDSGLFLLVVIFSIICPPIAIVFLIMFLFS